MEANEKLSSLEDQTIITEIQIENRHYMEADFNGIKARVRIPLHVLKLDPEKKEWHLRILAIQLQKKLKRALKFGAIKHAQSIRKSST